MYTQKLPVPLFDCHHEEEERRVIAKQAMLLLRENNALPLRRALLFGVLYFVRDLCQLFLVAQ